MESLHSCGSDETRNRDVNRPPQHRQTGVAAEPFHFEGVAPWVGIGITIARVTSTFNKTPIIHQPKPRQAAFGTISGGFS